MVLALITLIPTSCSNSSVESQGAQAKAAIIDQLYLLEPNPEFIEKTSTILEAQGYEVDVWQGEEITVEFYRDLPKHGYKIIVFRVHSGLLLSLAHAQIVPSETTYLFTGEKYVTTRYTSEQLSDRVSNALMTTEYPLVFAINSDFIKKDMEGNFDNTAILMMGCESYFFNDMANAFIQRGLLETGIPTLLEVGDFLRDFLMPPTKSMVTGHRFTQFWMPPGPWR